MTMLQIAMTNLFARIIFFSPPSSKPPTNGFGSGRFWTFAQQLIFPPFYGGGFYILPLNSQWCPRLSESRSHRIL